MRFLESTRVGCIVNLRRPPEEEGGVQREGRGRASPALLKYSFLSVSFLLSFVSFLYLISFRRYWDEGERGAIL